MNRHAHDAKKREEEYTRSRYEEHQRELEEQRKTLELEHYRKWEEVSRILRMILRNERHYFLEGSGTTDFVSFVASMMIPNFWRL